MDRPVLLDNPMDDAMEERIQELCDGRVLGTLADQERDELEQHRNTSEGQRVVRALQNAEETAAWLAWSSPPVAPPAALRQRLLERVAAEAAQTHAPHATNVVDFLESRRPTARPRALMAIAGLGWAAAAGLAVTALSLGNRAGTAEAQLAEARTQAADEINLLRTNLADRDRVLRIIGARDSRAIRLVSTQPEAPQYRAYWSETTGLVLAGNRVAAPAAGRTLQLWIVPKNGKPISAGVFAPTANGDVLLLAATNLATPDAAAALAITDEPTGGSAQPTTQPAWIGPVSGF